MIPKKQFEQWVRQQLFVATDEGPFRKFVLRHLSSATRTGSVLLTIESPENPEDLNDDWVENFLAQAQETAQGDSEGIGGTQRYRVEAYHGDSAAPTARFSIRTYGESEPEDEGLSSEPPTKSGLQAQTMRHLEAVMRITAMTQNRAFDAQQKMLTILQSQNEKLLEEKWKNFELVESLLSQKDEREIERAKAVQKLEMQEKLVDKVTLLLPTAVNRLFGGNNGQKVLPEKTTPMEEQLCALGETLQPTQLEELQRVLSTEQLMVFLDIFQNVNKKKMSLKEQEETAKSSAVKELSK